MTNLTGACSQGYTNYTAYAKTGALYQSKSFSIPVYENMTNTLKFLKDNGYELTTEPLKVKEVLYADKKMSLMEAQNEFARVNKADYRGWGEYDIYLSDYNNPMFEHTYFTFDANYNLGYFIDTSAPVTEYDMLNMIYKFT